MGSVQLGRGSIRPGAGVRKELPPLGDLFVTGAVNAGECGGYMALQGTKLGTIIPLSQFIARGITRALLYAGSGKGQSPRRPGSGLFSFS